MESSLLSIDLGNTSLKAVVWQGTRVVATLRLLHDETVIDPHFARAAATCRAVVGVASHGVRERMPACLRVLLDVTAQGASGSDVSRGDVRGGDVQANEIPVNDVGNEPKRVQASWVGTDIEPPGIVAYDDPAQLGLDRRVASWGAHVEHGAALILDCGTAVTLTHIDEAGTMHGLAIGAGLEAMRSGLAARAPALAPFFGGQVPEGLPRSSSDNLAIGIEVAFVGAIRELHADALRRLRAAGITAGVLLVTGTDGERVARDFAHGRYVRGLVHRGLRALSARS
ncbi:MAG: type III pantothenate kinase [Planctomycetes bacterium]|nr:type III pantothenate kinase [Planctomycetota bacterium]MCB9890719.1 type III pantothenate kinase [Planctomycetota bacterium]MCB9920058.1 type III pantothenate kinase [Planctomycetota bacterium]